MNPEFAAAVRASHRKEVDALKGEIEGVGEASHLGAIVSLLITSLLAGRPDLSSHCEPALLKKR